MDDFCMMFPDKPSIGGLQERPHFISSNHPISTVVVGDPASAAIDEKHRRSFPAHHLGARHNSFTRHLRRMQYAW